MCGIAGLVQPSPTEGLRPAAVLAALAARGGAGRSAVMLEPESAAGSMSQGDAVWAGLFQTWSPGGLPAPAPHEPLHNEDRSLWIVFDGVLHGWSAEARRLADRGHRFDTSSCAEFVLHAYEDWGESVLGSLRGDFALVLLDWANRRLLCARDRVGGRSLYYACKDGCFSFASSLSALRAVQGGLIPRIHPAAVDAYLAHRYVPAPLSLIEGVWKLPAGYKISWDFAPRSRAEPELECFWNPKPVPYEDIPARLREVVDVRLRRDGRNRLLLGGGIGSATVAQALEDLEAIDCSEALIEFGGNGGLATESAEDRFIRQLAGRLRLSVTALAPVRDPGEAMRLVAALDEPLGDPLAIDCWARSGAAARCAASVFSGEGGGFLFGGTRRHATHLRTAGLAWLRAPGPFAVQATRFLSQRTLTGKLQHLLLERQLSWEDDYALRFDGIDPLTRAYLQPDCDHSRIHYWRLPGEDFHGIEWMLECDRLNWLPEGTLRLIDACSAAHGLAVQHPLLDHKLIEAVLGLPLEKRFTVPAWGILRKFARLSEGFQPVAHATPDAARWLSDPFLAQRLRQLPQRLSDLLPQFSRSHLGEFLAAYDKDLASADAAWQLLVLELCVARLLEAP